MAGDREQSPKGMQPPLEGHSCALCARRKVRCDKKSPCTYCASRKVPCIPASPQAPRPRKKRFPEAELLARLKRYEAALKSYGANIDRINRGDSTLDNTRRHLKVEKIHQVEKKISDKRLSQKTQENSGISDTVQHNQEELLSASSQDQLDQCPFSADQNAWGQSETVLLFRPVTSMDLPNLHPPPVRIFYLWQIFLDNVHPLLKLFSATKIQQTLFKCASSLPTTSNSMHALLLGIYANAVQSMTNELCLEAMNEDRSVLLSRYTAGVQYALHKAGFLQSSDLTTLQAYVLFLYSVSTIIDPRSYSCLTAIADRIAKRDALHRGIQGEQLSAFDLEIRRRTWWHIVLLDSRAAEVSGSGTFVVDCQWKVNLPLNVNESDLNPETTSLPREYERATDMLFCLIRCEAAEFHRKFRARRILEEGCGNLKVPPLSLQEKLDSIDVFERHIEAKYLQYCDPQLLLHDLSRYYATYFLTKMRIITYGAYLSRGPFENTKTKDDHQDNVIRICLEAIEAYHCRVQNLMSLKFAWYLANTPPFLAVVNLFYILRERTEGELVARAWDIMGCQDEIFGRPDWICSFGPEMHEAKQGNMVATFAGLVVQAWEARRKVLGRENQIPMPRLMNKMKEVLGPLFRTKQSTTLDKSNHEKISTSGQPNLGDATKNWNVSDAAPYSQPSIMSQPETGPPAEYAPSINSAPPYMLDMPVDAYQVDGSWVEGDEWPILFPDDGRGLNVDWDQILFSMYQ